MSSFEFTIPRPGYFLPWLAIVKYDHGRQEWAWGVYHHDRTTRPVWDGREQSYEDARQAAIDAVESS